MDFERLSDEERAELDRLLAAPQSFQEFTEIASPKFQFYTHNALLAEALERVVRGETKRLMVFMPPRHGKSEQVSRLFPAYYLHQHPDRWVAVASYAMPLARTFSRDARRYFTGTVGELAGDSEAVEQWETGRGGGLWAVGRGGSATGKGAHLFLVDDPIKDQVEADSEVIRASLHDWYKAVVNTRLEPGGAVVIVQTRWHEDDLAGHLLEIERTSEHPEEWEIVNLPAEGYGPQEAPEFPPTCTVVRDWRKEGEPLCPERYNSRALASIRATSGQRVWDALFQQRPSNAKGTVFKREWWQFYRKDDLPRRFDRVIDSWDLAFKDHDSSDFVAGHKYGRSGAKVYLLERWTERLDFSQTVQQVVALAYHAPKAQGVYVEDKANGPAVLNVLLDSVPGLVAVEPDGSKIARAYAAQPIAQARQVYLPHPDEAPWVEEFVRQLAAFPTGAHDDDVDAFSQAIAQLFWELKEPPEVKWYGENERPPIDPATGLPKRPSLMGSIWEDAERDNGKATRSAVPKTRVPRFR